MSAAGLRRALATLRWPALCAALATHAGLFFLLHAAGTGAPRPTEAVPLAVELWPGGAMAGPGALALTAAAPAKTPPARPAAARLLPRAQPNAASAAAEPANIADTSLDHAAERPLSGATASPGAQAAQPSSGMQDGAGGAADGHVGSAAVAARYDAAYLRNPPPEYPPVARRRGEAGTVLLSVWVEADGRAGEVSVRQGSGSARLDRAALEAVRRWRFVPAKNGGVALASRIEVPIVFRLED